MRLGKAPVGNAAQLLRRGSLGAHYLLYQPLQWLELSTGSTLMHPFPNFSRSSCLKRSWKKSLLSLSLPHHTLAQQLEFPVVPMLRENTVAELDLRSETVSWEARLLPHSLKNQFLFSVFPAWLLPLFFPQTRSPAKCAFLCYDKRFLARPVKEWTLKVGLGLFFRKFHTHISWYPDPCAVPLVTPHQDFCWQTLGTRLWSTISWIVRSSTCAWVAKGISANTYKQGNKSFLPAADRECKSSRTAALQLIPCYAKLEHRVNFLQPSYKPPENRFYYGNADTTMAIATWKALL